MPGDEWKGSRMNVSAACIACGCFMERIGGLKGFGYAPILVVKACSSDAMLRLVHCGSRRLYIQAQGMLSLISAYGGRHS